MSRKPGTAYPDKCLPPAIVELKTRSPEVLPAVEKIGMMAVFHTANSRRLPFASGAEGHTLSQVHIEGELFGRSLGRLSMQMPPEPGNVLLVPRECLIDTRTELSKYSSSRIPFDGRNMVQGIMQFLQGREVGGVRYDACISYSRNDPDGTEEITCALPGPDQELIKLRIPLLES